jgi:hypothetical protein
MHTGTEQHQSSWSLSNDEHVPFDKLRAHASVLRTRGLTSSAIDGDQLTGLDLVCRIGHANDCRNSILPRYHAPWELEPPISITRPPAVKNSGVQPGSVDGATKISPARGAHQPGRVRLGPVRHGACRGGTAANAPSAGRRRLRPASGSVPSERSRTRNVPPLQLLLVRLAPLDHQRPQISSCQTATDLAQVKEEHIINVFDDCGRQLAAARSP